MAASAGTAHRGPPATDTGSNRANGAGRSVLVSEQQKLRSLRGLVQSLPLPPVPDATYRVQFHAGFGFEDARKLVDYLHDLGISHLYASPYLRARSGSTHGYDVADPNALNPELGSREDYERMVAELRAHGMQQLVDVVPNHMGIGDPGNLRWLDVLENGPSSIYADFFDINWTPLKAAGEADQGRVILPVLGDQYGVVLEKGELQLGYQDGAFFVCYYDNRYPVAPDTYPLVLEVALEEMQQELGRRDESVQELASILTALRHLPPRGDRAPAALEERNREKEIVKRRIRELHQASPQFRNALQTALAAFTGQPGERSSFDRLDDLLERQAYRLAFWRVASEEINYRRFFDITELAAVRMEDPVVFRDTHRLLLRLVREHKVTSLRIDHPDGLRDPARYFWDLQRSCLARYFAPLVQAAVSVDGRANGAGETAALAHESVEELERLLERLFDRERARGRGARWRSAFYVVAEKILSADEQLRKDWTIAGTTGYDFLNVVNGLFVDRENERFVDNVYSRFIDRAIRYPDLANSTKKMVMLISLASEINELGYEVKRIASADRRHRDFTLNLLIFAIREVIAGLSVYRTYIDPQTGAPSEADRECVQQAVREAKRRNPRTDPSLFEFIGDTLLLRHLGSDDQAARDEHVRFTARFQQTTGPVMAKGVEDTAFYVYNRLVSLNEVGGEPNRFGESISAFHRYNQDRARRWPTTLLTTSTHDTKRSEDVRTRIDALSEMPREWRAALTRWSRMNASSKHSVDGPSAPDRNEEYLLYQTLLGAWPLEGLSDERREEFQARVAQAMLKSIKEAKVNTSWTNPNPAYEQAVEDFVRAVLDGGESNAFLGDFQDFQRRVSFFGMFSSLSQTLLKLTSPGVPDIYQGNEVWDFSLVDPDNRREVDYERRISLLRDLRSRAEGKDEGAALAEELVRTREDGRIKLWVTHCALRLRREMPELFRAGSYRPLRAVGAKRQHLCAYERVWNGHRVAVAAPVLLVGLTGGRELPPVGDDVWEDTFVALGDGPAWRNAFTGERLTAAEGRGGIAIPAGRLLRDFPVALLVANS